MLGDLVIQGDVVTAMIVVVLLLLAIVLARRL
jgi:hypothetical protein